VSDETLLPEAASPSLRKRSDKTEKGKGKEKEAKSPSRGKYSGPRGW
jgi:hypothetical protein